jgi:hypothetical protein
MRGRRGIAARARRSVVNAATSAGCFAGPGEDLNALLGEPRPLASARLDRRQKPHRRGHNGQRYAARLGHDSRDREPDKVVMNLPFLPPRRRWYVNHCDRRMSGERTVLPGGSRSKGTIACVIASCVLSLRWEQFAAFAAALVFSSPLSTTSNPFAVARSARKALHIGITKATALSTASERCCWGCRAAHREVTERASVLSISTPSHDDAKPTFRPLRC